MAQLIRCDRSGCETIADWLVTQTANGDTSAWCIEHYLEVTRAAVYAMDAEERDATDADALRRLGAVAAPDVDTSPAHVVKRGTSARRQAWEARRRSGMEPLGDDPGPDTRGPDDPDDEPSDEPVAEASGVG